MDFDVDLLDLTCPDLFLISVERVTNIKVALAKWLQKHSFDAEYTIIRLPTDDQHAKEGFCGKNWLCNILASITIRPLSAVVDFLTYDSFR